MSYYKILCKYGVDTFADNMAVIGMRGAIAPDWPPEEAVAYLMAMKRNREFIRGLSCWKSGFWAIWLLGSFVVCLLGLLATTGQWPGSGLSRPGLLVSLDSISLHSSVKSAELMLLPLAGSVSQYKNAMPPNMPPSHATPGHSASWNT